MLNLEKIKRLFWDVDFTKLDSKRDKQYLIERVLENGDDKAVAEILNNYSHKEISEVIVKSRRLSRKTANFWKIKLNIFQPIKCLQTQSQNPLSKLWN